MRHITNKIFTKISYFDIIHIGDNMKRGFTLIELLAVIVILAIIALIAVPIVINIINDSRESGYKRSVEAYGKAIEQAIASYQINHPNEEAIGIYETGTTKNKLIKKSTTSNDVSELTIDYEGTPVSCETIITYENGTIYVSDCTVGEHKVEYTYGNAIRYYYYDNESIHNKHISQGFTRINANPDLSKIETNGHKFYFAFDTRDGVTIDAAYVCFIKNNNEYCLKNEITYQNNQPFKEKSDYYEANVKIVQKAFSGPLDILNLYHDLRYEGESEEICVHVYKNGAVIAYDQELGCAIFQDGFFTCGDSILTVNQ